MRNWAGGCLGFIVGATSLFSLLTIYSVSQPGLWLTVAFGLGLYPILTLVPRFSARARVALTLVFAAGVCLLWLWSASDYYLGRWLTVHRGLEISLGVLGLIGLFTFLPEVARRDPRHRASVGGLLFLFGAGWTIAYLSSAHGGASPMLDWVVAVFGLDRSTAELLVVVARKAVHFCAYAAVALAGMSMANKNGASRKQGVLAALSSAVLFATFDELRQSMESGRGGSIYDVLLDMSGAITATAMIAYIARKQRGNRPIKMQKSSTL